MELLEQTTKKQTEGLSEIALSKGLALSGAFVHL